MKSYPLAVAAQLISDPGRAAMLTALLDRSSRPASELAQIAGVSQQSASVHLAKLLVGGFVAVVRRGRYRYYRLASPDIAHALESLGSIATIRVDSKRPNVSGLDVRTIRTCYDHMAGRIAVQLATVLREKKILADRESKEFALTTKGELWFAGLGMNCADLRKQRRHFALKCIDWTERIPHVGGALGAALLKTFLENRWVENRPDTRALRLTPKGSRFLSLHGIDS